MPRAGVALLCLLALAACGPVPRPFQSEDKAANDLLHLADRAGIAVAPVSGDLPVDPGALAEAMAERLRRLNVPATTDAVNGESRVLHGRAARRARAGGRDEIVIEWELWDISGERIGARALSRQVAAVAGQADAARLIEDLTAEAAPAIAAMVQDPPVEWAAIPGFPRARLVVLPLAAGPGDSRRSLPGALRAALSAARLPVAPGTGAGAAMGIGEDDLLVLGDVALGPATAGRQDIVITWFLVSARDDKELGQVAQRNSVPAGSLDGPWGALAREVARGAAEGVIDLLGRAPRR